LKIGATLRRYEPKHAEMLQNGQRKLPERVAAFIRCTLHD